jgi:hypothetical protein
MRFCCLVIALAFVAATASDSWGQQKSKQPPAKSQQEQTAPQEQKAATDQRGTDKLPFVVQPLPTKKTAEIAEREKQETKEKTDSDWWTWLLTFLTVVALFGQLAVFVAQAYFLKGTLAATATAADAANLNAEAVISAERAYVFVEIERQYVMEIIRQIAGTQQQPFKISIAYCFTNEGRTPAIIRAISYGAIVAENLPREREYSPVLHLPTHLFGAGKSTKSLEYEEFQMTTAMADSIIDLKATFWFYGNIVYDDMFSRQKTLDFVFHASGVSEGFTLYRYEETDEKREN